MVAGLNMRLSQWPTQQKTLALIGITALVKLIVAFTLDLGTDEVYYTLYAEYPDWSYFDHPGMVGWLIWLTTGGNAFATEALVRLGAVVCSSLATWMVYLTAREVHSGRAGFVAAVLFSGSYYFSLIAGTFILPDSPQILFWSGAVYAFVCYTKYPKTGYLLAFGICAGLATLSKYHGLALPLAAFLAGTLHPLLRTKWLAISGAALLSALFMLPIIWWAYTTGFEGFAYHSGRVGGNALRLDLFAPFVLGQVVYQNPVCVGLVIVGLVQRSPIRPGLRIFLWCTALPLLLAFHAMALFRFTLPHWTGPAIIGLIVLASPGLSEMKLHRGWFLWAWGLFVVGAPVLLTVLLLIPPASFAPVNADYPGKGNVILDVRGWKPTAGILKPLVARHIRENEVLIAHKWFPGAHLDYYFARPEGFSLLVPGTPNDVHQFGLINQRRHAHERATGLFIELSDHPCDPCAHYAGKYIQCHTLDSAEVVIQNKLARSIRLYRITELAVARDAYR